MPLSECTKPNPTMSLSENSCIGSTATILDDYTSAKRAQSPLVRYLPSVARRADTLLLRLGKSRATANGITHDYPFKTAVAAQCARGSGTLQDKRCSKVCSVLISNALQAKALSACKSPVAVKDKQCAFSGSRPITKRKLRMVSLFWLLHATIVTERSNIYPPT